MIPTITKKSVIDYLRSKLDNEVFSEMPVDETTVRYGVYVSNPLTTSISTTRSGFTNCGTQIDATDNIEILVISTQDDEKLEHISDVITDIPYSILSEGYTDIVYQTQRRFENRAEYRRYSFDFKRIDF